ncbi:MAG: electron transfer flavoprotein subunit beta/FixA family protein [Clostridia bacterium]|nr:electron transfer flavoprotein subunit beta/FixA family protein [Clostridia bacterium]MBQ3867324.1 electron transfer flavoprotein subunit beta/FixA family protein [Clostridia bacterium]
MRIVVCVKQVPATTDAKIDPETKRIVREGTKAVLNPFDLYAVEEALRIRERCGGEVVALSMGPENAKNVLVEALSMGADRAVLLSGRGFAGSDTWATSYALAKAIERLGGAELIICGKQAVDGDTAQVGPGIAAKLDIMQAANVSSVDDICPDSITVSRMNETGYDVLKLRFPALITVLKDINVPRIPTLRNARKARAAEIAVWSPEDIGAEPDKIGLNASPTRVVKTEPPAVRAGASVRICAAPSEAAKALTEELFRRGLIRADVREESV